MRSRNEVVINLALDWRVLSLAVLLIALGVVMVLTAGAQGPPTANGDVGMKQGADPAREVTSAAPSDPAAAQRSAVLQSFYLTDRNYSGR
jgi:hypothetical protein